MFAVFLSIGSILTFSSCDEVEDAVDDVTYSITIRNNTDMTLVIFESVDDSDFEEATTVNSGDSGKVVGVVDSKVELEARDRDGNVVASETYNQSEDTDQTWEIN